MKNTSLILKFPKDRDVQRDSRNRVELSEQWKLSYTLFCEYMNRVYKGLEAEIHKGVYEFVRNSIKRNGSAYT
jgi:hypothetical protein